MTKAELRIQKQRERDAFDTLLQAEWSALMCLNLTQCFEYLHCDVLHCYLSFRSEARTSDIIHQAWRDAKTVVVPVISDTGEMLHKEYHPDDVLESGRYGIPEPYHTRYVSESRLATSQTVVIAPMLAFNEGLYRLGYGKGYYDRLLTLKNIVKFGLAYSFQFSDEFVPEAHDVALDAIITEQGVARRAAPNTIHTV